MQLVPFSSSTFILNSRGPKTEVETEVEAEAAIDAETSSDPCRQLLHCRFSSSWPAVAWHAASHNLLMPCMDNANVHHFWGSSPAVDLLAVADQCKAAHAVDTQPLRILQVGMHAALRHTAHMKVQMIRATPFGSQACSSDARHTIQTLCHLARHAGAAGRPCACSSMPLSCHCYAAALVWSIAGPGCMRAPCLMPGTGDLFIYEEEPEVLMRHVLLLAVLLDGRLLARERMEMLLELHSNALVREPTAQYLGDLPLLLLQRHYFCLCSGPFLVLPCLPVHSCMPTAAECKQHGSHATMKYHSDLLAIAPVQVNRARPWSLLFFSLQAAQPPLQLLEARRQSWQA